MKYLLPFLHVKIASVFTWIYKLYSTSGILDNSMYVNDWNSITACTYFGGCFIISSSVNECILSRCPLYPNRTLVYFQKIKKITTRIYEHYTACAPEEAGISGHRTTWDGLVYSVWVPGRGPFLLSEWCRRRHQIPEWINPHTLCCCP